MPEAFSFYIRFRLISEVHQRLLYGISAPYSMWAVSRPPRKAAARARTCEGLPIRTRNFTDDIVRFSHPARRLRPQRDNLLGRVMFPWMTSVMTATLAGGADIRTSMPSAANHGAEFLALVSKMHNRATRLPLATA